MLIHTVSNLIPRRMAEWQLKTVARKSSIGRLCVWAGGLDIQIWQNSTDLCFKFQLGALGALFGRPKPTKTPRGDGAVATADMKLHMEHIFSDDSLHTVAWIYQKNYLTMCRTIFGNSTCY